MPQQIYITVQNGPCVLAIVNFSSPGGDKDRVQDIIRDGTFYASRLMATFVLYGAPKDFQVLFNGEKVNLPFMFKVGDRLSMDLNGVYLGLTFPGACFGENIVRGEIKFNKDGALCNMILFDEHEPKKISWKDIKRACRHSANNVF
ncbi:MAG: hypothetical protein QXV82_10510 [Ignisphaera sp.]